MNTVTEETITVKGQDGEKKEMSRREVLAILNARTLVTKQREIDRGTMDGDDYQRKILVKYPRIVAHLICESLGYFCPRSAANAVQFYLDAKPFYCEWYCSWRNKDLVQVGKEVLKSAIKGRHRHTGYMAEYLQGRLVVERELHGHGPELASWF